MILSHARLPVPTLPHECVLNIAHFEENVNQIREKLTKKLTKQLLDEFIKSRRQGLSRRTVLFYQMCLSKAIDVDLTPSAINGFLACLTCGNGKFAYYRAVRAFCNWAYKAEYINENPIDKVDPPKVAKKILPSVTSEQVLVLLSMCDSTRDKAIVSLLFDSGLRLSELCSIKVNDIDWATNTIRVIVKGNREARAAFTVKTADLLKRYLFCDGNNGTLFDMKPRGIQDMLSRLSESVGFPCNAHSFRRGFACNLHKKGLSTLSIMYLGRWSSLEMVSRYCKSLTFDDCLKQYNAVNI